MLMVARGAPGLWPLCEGQGGSGSGDNYGEMTPISVGTGLNTHKDTAVVPCEGDEIYV